MALVASAALAVTGCDSQPAIRAARRSEILSVWAQVSDQSVPLFEGLTGCRHSVSRNQSGEDSVSTLFGGMETFPVGLSADAAVQGHVRHQGQRDRISEVILIQTK